MPSQLLARVRRSLEDPSVSSNFSCRFGADAPGILGVQPEGNLDAPNHRLAFRSIEENLDESVRFVVLDLSRTGELDAAGIGMLIALQKKMRAAGGDLVLHGLRPKLARFLGTAGFSTYFSIALDAPSALDYIAALSGGGFPAAIVCPACLASQTAGQPGKFRCRACRAVITVLPDGSPELG